MIKYFVIAIIAVNECSGSFNALRGYLRDLPLPLAAAAVVDRHGSGKSPATAQIVEEPSQAKIIAQPVTKSDTIKPVSKKPAAKSYDLTDDEIINLFVRNAH